MLGAYVAAFDTEDYSARHLPEYVIASQPAPLPARAPKLGTNLERNRSAMLASLVSSNGD